MRTKEEIKEYQKSYRASHKKKQSEYDKKLYSENKEHFRIKNKSYDEKNKEKRKLQRKKYYEENKEIIKIKHKNYIKNKRKNDIFLRIHESISKQINKKILNIKSNDGYSIFDFLPYSVNELKNHIENKFENWMNWENWGTYRKNLWKDEDPNTWTWQIDHIIPRSLLKYSSINDENFKKCWSLDNLKPISSKKNLEKGNKIK